MSTSVDGAPRAARMSDAGTADNPSRATPAPGAGPEQRGTPVTLAYAPPAEDPRRIRYAVAAGVVTTLATQVIVWLLNERAGINVMGWYPKLLPIGAVLVGLAAASGYALACRWWGIKVTRALIVAILLAQACSYAGARYLELRAAGPLVYRATNRRVGFTDYFHLQTVNITWSGTLVGAASKSVPIGGWGYVLIGAVLVGLAAASGYALACRWWGIKVTRALIAAILLAQACSYAGARYLEFRAAGPPLVYRATNRRVGFLDYFHLQTVNGTLVGAASKPVPIGGWGYVLRTAELLGFVFGGLIPVGMIVRVGYCDLCQRYMTSKRLAVLPGSVRVRSVSRRNPAAFAAHYAEHQQAWTLGQSTLEGIQRLAAAGDVDAFAREVERFRVASRAADRLPRRIQVHLVFCPNCRSGTLQPRVVTSNNNAREDVVQLPPVPLRPEFVRRVAA